MASFSSALSREVERSKKDKRLESKKKKALAFLELLETKPVSKDEPPAKKARVQVESEESAQQPEESGEVSDTPSKKEVPTEDDRYAEAKRAARAHRQAAMGRPKIFLTLKELPPQGSFPSGCKKATNESTDSGVEVEGEKIELEEKTPPLFMMDLQHLLLYCSMKNYSSYKPRWCQVLRPGKISSVVLVVLNDVSIEDFQNYPECFPFIKENFPTYVEMVTPSQYGSTLDEDVYGVPLSISQMKKYTRRPDLREKVIRLISPPNAHGGQVLNSQQDQNSTVKSETSAASSSKSEAPGKDVGSKNGPENGPENGPVIRDVVPRTTLLLNSMQLLTEGYPVPVATQNGKYADFVFTKDKYKPVTPHSPLYAVDCEMCLTTVQKNELTRVSIVDEDGNVLYDTLVKPYNRIINYLTKYSGITKKMLEPVQTRLEDVQREFQRLLPPDAILCGQSLCGDLIALKMFHPYVIDTSVIYNMSGNRKIKCGLKKLTNVFLGRSIQDSLAGHCSSEDAVATMELVKLKLSKSLDFGDAVMGGVYFPDLNTYFLKPHAAQNVQETFHPTNTPKQTGANSEMEDTPLKGSENDKDSEKDKNQKGKSATKVIRDTLKKMMSVEVDQRRVFFQQQGNMLMHSFFELMAESNFSVALVGSKKMVAKYEEEPGLKAVAKETDKERCKEAKALCGEKDLTWVELTTFADKVSEDEKEDVTIDDDYKAIFCELDKRVKKLVSKVRAQTVVTVVMSGRSCQGQHYNAATFVEVL